MLILHASALPAGPSGNAAGLCLWAETTEDTPRRRRSTRGGAPHPFSAAASSIIGALSALEYLPDLGELAKVENVALRLPSTAQAPLPSPDLARIRMSDALKPTQLTDWRVETCAFAPPAALTFFAALPYQVESPAFMLSDDARYWSLAAKFALELLARQRFLPALGREGGHYQAQWIPSLDDARDQQRFGLLVKALPPIARAASRDDIAPRALLHAFLSEAIDGKVRGGARQHIRASRGSNVETKWLAALFGPDAQVDAKAGELASFRESLETWQQQLQVTGDEGYRACFRLEPPNAAPRPPGARGERRDWLLTFHLQPADDLSLLVPAEQVWAERGASLRLLKRRFEDAQERLLAALGYAARLFPPLERALRERAPTGCALSAGEAHQFLSETALLLETSGFAVRVPPWWASRKGGLGLRARVTGAKQSNAQAAKGMLGLDSLVNFEWQVSIGGEALTREDFERLAALKQPLVQIRGQWVELRPTDVAAAMQFWQKRSEQATLRDALNLSLGPEGERQGLAVTAVDADGWVGDFIAQLRDGEKLAMLPQPAAFQGTLRPYQLKGFAWLAFMRRWGLGACLADDMGLGKTIQLIALLLHQAASRPTLLICPTSVVGNWQREVEKFAPHLRVLVHHGSARKRDTELVAQANAHDVVISSYGLMLRDEAMLAQVQWAQVVLDEAQNIKNPSARQTQAARKLPATQRIALTGTPVENRLSELWSIMEFLNPGYLGSQKSFRDSFARPIERYQDPAATERLKSLVQPFILRRLKTDPRVIQDLPDKLEMKVFCNLTKEQATLYQAVVKDTLQQIEAAEGIQRRGLVLAMLMKLKQVCNHPAQFLGDHSALPERSGKLARLSEMLEEVIAASDRALVFTQFAEMGEMLKAHLQATFGGEFLFLHGGTPQKMRDKMVARFQQEQGGPLGFILSLKAGGTGLNLTRANHVFHFDRWWNPAVENQATDRAFRIGQKRNVQVHKFVCIGTMEERIDALIESKQALAANVLGAGEAWLTELSSAELRDIFTLRREAVAD